MVEGEPVVRNYVHYHLLLSHAHDTALEGRTVTTRLVNRNRLRAAFLANQPHTSLTLALTVD